MDDFEKRIEYAKIKTVYREPKDTLSDWFMKVMCLTKRDVKVGPESTDEEIQAEVDRLARNARC